MTTPCKVLSRGDLAKSLKPKASHCKGWSYKMGKTGGKKTDGLFWGVTGEWGSVMAPA
jgi:hypothetical protein